MLTLTLALLVVQAPAADIRLGRPDGVLPHEFSQLRGVRELADERVIVSDWIEEVVGVADFDRRSFRAISRKGTGPAEYRLPARLIALPGDSTLLVDEGNARLAVIAPALGIVRSFSSHRPGMGFALAPRAADRRGRLYFEVPGWADPTPPPGDSTSVARWDPRTERVERLAVIKGITYRKGRSLGIPYVIFAPVDAWQADADGGIRLLRAADYRMDVRAPDGTVTRGPATPFRPLPVTERDRLDYVTRFLNSSPISGRGGGGMSALPAAMKTPEAIAEMAARQQYAATRPPFTDRAPILGADGTLWAERSVPAGAASVVDRFDARGARKAGVILPAGRRLAGVGRRFIYLAAMDEDGIERLERYPAPAR